jgi:hypothetical protein
VKRTEFKRLIKKEEKFEHLAGQGKGCGVDTQKVVAGVANNFKIRRSN